MVFVVLTCFVFAVGLTKFVHWSNQRAIRNKRIQHYLKTHRSNGKSKEKEN